MAQKGLKRLEEALHREKAHTTVSPGRILGELNQAIQNEANSNSGFTRHQCKLAMQLAVTLTKGGKEPQGLLHKHRKFVLDAFARICAKHSVPPRTLPGQRLE